MSRDGVIMLAVIVAIFIAIRLAALAVRRRRAKRREAELMALLARLVADVKRDGIFVKR